MKKIQGWPKTKIFDLLIAVVVKKQVRKSQSRKPIKHAQN